MAVSGWVPVQADWWRATAEALPRPWKDETACIDLRWWVDQDGKVPSRRVLADRWGWSDGRVRGLLRTPARWWDPKRGEIPQLASPRPPDPACTSPDPAGPSRTQPDTGEPGEYRPPDPAGPSLHQAGPSAHHTRVDPPSPSPSPSPGDKEQLSVGPPGAPVGLEPEDDLPVLTEEHPTVFDMASMAYLQAATYFGEIVHRAIGRRPSKGPERSSKVGQRLYRECRKDQEKVLDALRFAGESQIDRAVKLREYDGLTVETVLRHLDEYAELWRIHADRPSGTARAPPKTNGHRHRHGHAGDGVLEALMDREFRKREDGGDIWQADPE